MAISRRSFLASATGVAAAATANLTFGSIRAQADPSSYSATWASVDQHTAAPEWFQDAKFGIYHHWGVFSVPAYGNEWYPRNMYAPGSAENKHHIATYGDPSVWPYNNFIDGALDKTGNHVQFAPKLKSAGGNFDPDDWAQLFADAGARFAGPVAEHHDGFSMWDSAANEWNSVKHGPHLNLLQLFRDAVRGKGMKFLVAMHHAYHFNGYYQYVPAQSTQTLKKLYGQLGTTAENQLWYDKLKEVVDQAQPDILWEDFDLTKVDESKRLDFLSYYYNQANSWGREVVATYKDGYDNKGEVFDYERGGPADITSPYWLTDDSISSSSWCYTQGIGYYSTTQLLHALIDRVSKNGNMLLNIAPMADGTIPQGQRDILLGIGDHLKRFGESIYSTRAWTTYGEGPTKMGGGSFTNPTAGTAQDIRFTRSKDSTVLYATILGWPGASTTITTLASGRIDLSSLKSAQLLGPNAGGSTNLPAPKQDSAGLRITLPSSSAPFSALAYVVKLTFSGQIPALGPAVAPTSAATAYGDVSYEGASASLPLGGYTSAQLQALGLAARSISSVRVPAGYQVIGYANDNFSGTSWTFSADNSDLRATGNNDAITSLKVIFNPSAYFSVTNVTDGLVLDGGGNVAAGSNLKQWTAGTSTNLQWQAVDLGNGYYRLVNRTNGFVADSYGATTNGSPARQAAWNGGNNQQWQFTDRGNGQYSIANRGSGLVLDGGGPVASGSVTKLWTWDSSPNLLWTLTAR
jgi:alpha-L-fucosidase